MCVTFLAIAAKQQLVLGRYKLILVNNRDEFFDRPTSALAWRDGILAGRDEEANEKGTWLGVDVNGRIGNLLSITEPKAMQDAPSRGRLVNDFLSTSGQSARNYMSEIAQRAHEYNGFQFLALDRIEGEFELYSLTNKIDLTGPVHWPNGIYGFGNSPRSVPFQKVIYGENKFRELLEHSVDLEEDQLVKSLFKFLSDRTVHFPDEQIREQTGAPPGSDLYKMLCSLFIDGTSKQLRNGKHYGTRSSSIILVDAQDTLTFHERQVLDPAKEMDDTTKWAFSMQQFFLGSQNIDRRLRKM